MSTNRFSDATDALLAAVKAAPALAAIPVYDGAAITAAADLEFILVGHDGTTEADGTLTGSALAGQYVHQWSDTTRGLEEDGSVNCLVVSQTGDPADMAGRRDRCQVLTAAVEDAAAASGGALVSGLTFDGVTDGRFTYRQSGNGVAVMHAFRLAYSTGY